MNVDLITGAWTLISFVFLVMSILVIFPSRREVDDAMREVESLGQALDGTRVIAESELALRVYMRNAQMCGTVVMIVFLGVGLMAILIPPETSHGEMRTLIVAGFLIGAEIFDGLVQGFLFLATLEMRQSRQKWREVAADPTANSPYPEMEKEMDDEDADSVMPEDAEPDEEAK